MKISYKAKRNIKRIIPFGIIWLIPGWVFILVETAAMGTFDPDSPTIISLNVNVFVFASLAVFLVGILVGAIELIWLEDLFRKESFLRKILYKLGIYTALLLLIIAVTYPLAASFEQDIPITDPRVWSKFKNFLLSITFLSTLLQMTFSLILCLVYAAISENLGFAVLTNLVTGKYHRPREEKRIFMFLDMKSSTAVAEKLGHVRYFDLLSDYYADLSESIINHRGEVYQYIGDEVVISWKYKDGLRNNNCLDCFFAMKKDLTYRKDYYNSKYGFLPKFKAGLHFGDVTTGEIGALKKEIFFTGDVLNVTARIQGLCNQYKEDLLISGDLFQELKMSLHYETRSLGRIEIKGRTKPMELFAVGNK